MIVVTGATGHVGNVLVKRLVKEGHEVGVIAHNKPPESVMGDIKYKIFQGDITDYRTLIAPFREATEGVFHLAAKISIATGEYDELQKINVQGTANVVRACLEANVKRLVYVSSVHALEEAPFGTPITEKVPETLEHVMGDYAKSKVLAYREVMKGVVSGLNAVIVFPTGIIGPFDYRPSQIGQMVRGFLQGKPVNYLEGAYDYVDVRDVIQGMLIAYKKGKTGEGYLLSGNPVTVKHMYDVLQEVTGRKAKMRKLPTNFILFISYFAEFFTKLFKKEPILTPYSVKVLQSNPIMSSKKAEKELGYKPRSFKDTIKDEVDWFNGKEVPLY